MFNAPKIIMNIKDIAEIYKINDSQEAELENAVETLENNIFLEKMGGADDCPLGENAADNTPGQRYR